MLSCAHRFCCYPADFRTAPQDFRTAPARGVCVRTRVGTQAEHAFISESLSHAHCVPGRGGLGARSRVLKQRDEITVLVQFAF